eukprot:CAMPEP_0175181210 /NCGR_PEP_ID=MMETSP0087-20121206/36521_1 /TAXON_ID=136419 /ORGANISM="Unknown Unknown, Strain D1" /LENGTH=714 /DNA_ID=CAMNT_0016473685 /DNA_START=68 /DNA_END=2212 /DNA_ORIENTATION=+
MIPVTVTVIVPAVAQSLVAGSSVSFSSIIISEPDNGSNSFRLQASAVLSGLTTDATTAEAESKLVYNGITVGDPPLTIVGGQDLSLSLDGRLKLETLGGFGAFAQAMMVQPTVSLSLQTDAIEASAMGFTTEISLDMPVTVTGVGVQNGRITDFEVPSTTGKQIDVFARLEAYNPSPVTMLDVGDLFFDLQYTSNVTATVGHCVVRNFTVLAYSNLTLDLQGGIVAKPQDLPVVSSMFTKFVSGADTIMTAKVRQSREGEEANLFWKSLAGVALTMPFRTNTDIPLLTDINLQKVDLSMGTGDQVQGAMQLSSSFNVPVTFGFKVIEVTPNLQFMDPVTLVKFAEIKPKPVPVDISVVNGKGLANLAIAQTPLVSLEADNKGFGNLIRQVIVSRSAVCAMTGTIAARASTVIGEIGISGIPVEGASFSMDGMESFENPPIEIISISVTDGRKLSDSTQELDVRASARITNPTKNSMNLTKIGFNLNYENSPVGYVTASSASLSPGPNNLAMTGKLIDAPSGSALIRKLLSRYLKNEKSGLTMHGRPESCDNNMLKNAFKNITMAASLPGLGEGLIKGARLKPDIFGALFGKKDMPTRVLVLNPLDKEIRLRRMDFEMFANRDLRSDKLGEIKLDMNDMKLAPNAVTLSEQVIATVPLSGAALSTLLKSLTGTPKVSATGTLEMSIGGFVGTVDYQQLDITAEICSSDSCMNKGV